jgi:KaiC/GvpD/RAD55 family RecA-like ATPase
VLDFFDSIWHETDGYVYLPVKESDGRLRRYFYRWPEKREAVAKFVLKHAANPEAEIFFSPAIYSKMSATQEAVKGSWVVWADFDGNFPEEWPTAVVPRPSVEIQSSTDRKRHVYWRLHEFIDDRKAVEKINRSIAYALGADASGWDASQFLRPPFTVNRKYASPLPVEIVADRLELVYNADAFNDIPTPTEAIRESLDLDNIPPVSEVLALAKWDKEAIDLFTMSFQEMSGPGHDRSGALQRLAYFGAESNWTDEQIMSVLLDADDRWKKYSTRPTRTKILSEIINRARAKHGYNSLSPEGLLRTLMAEETGVAEVETDDEQVIFSVREIASMPEIDDWVIKDVLVPEGVGLITGRPGVGKTQLAMQMAADLAVGREQFMDWDIPEPQKVLFLSLELSARQLGHIARAVSNRYPEKALDKNLVIHGKGDPLPMDEKAGQRYLLQLLSEHKPDVVFVDSMSLAVSEDPNDNKAMKLLFDFLKVARNHLHFSLVIVHHHRKKANDAQSKKTPDSQSDIYGSYIIASSVDFVINLEELGDDRKNGELSLSYLKNRYAPPIEPFKVRRSPQMHFERAEVDFTQTLGLGDE